MTSNLTAPKPVSSEEVADLLRERTDHAARRLTGWRASVPLVAQARHDHLGSDCSMCNKPSASGDELTGFALWLEVEERCNLDCRFCYNPWRQDRTTSGGLTSTEWTKVVDVLLDELTITSVTLSGGEPLMFPGLVELARHISGRGVPIALTTNGRSGTRRRIRQLAEAGVRHVSVPVHSSVPEVHDELVRANSWPSAVRCLAFAREAGLDVAMSFVATSKNTSRTDLDGLAHIVEQLGIRKLVANCFHPAGQGVSSAEDLSLEPGRFADAVDHLRKILPRAEVVVGSPDPLAGTVAERLRSPLRRLAVSPNGELKFCNHSSSGMINLAAGARGDVVATLREISAGRHQGFLDLVDNCACLGSGG